MVPVLLRLRPFIPTSAEWATSIAASFANLLTGLVVIWICSHVSLQVEATQAVPWGSKDPAWEVAFTSGTDHKAVYALRSDVVHDGSERIVGHTEVGTLNTLTVATFSPQLRLSR